jgi:hypothetical protein
MAGPACAVLIGSPLSESRAAIISVLTSLGGSARDDSADAFDLEVVDPTPVRGSRVSGPRGAIASLECPPTGYEEGELQQLEAVTGIFPRTSIGLSVWEAEPQDHRLLAEMALFFAEEYSGIIDFGGALCPLLPWWRSVERTSWEELSERWKAMVRGFPGTIWELPYQTANGKSWVYHVADAPFLRAWMAAPQFHMVK